MKTKTIALQNSAKTGPVETSRCRFLSICIVGLIFFVNVPVTTSAQTYLYHYQMLLNNELDVRNHTLTRTTDDGYLVAAGFISTTGWNYPHGLALYKLDASLTIQWNIAFAPADPEIHTFIVEDLIESASGEIVVCGSLRSNAFRSSRAFVARFTSDGNLLWFRTYAPGLSFTSIVERSDQAGFMACGDALYMTRSHGLVCWMDEQGQPIWSYHLPVQVPGTRARYEEIITTDDGCLVVGNINFKPTWNNPDYSEVLLSKFNWDGVVQYHTVYRSAPDSSFRHVPVAKSLTANDSVVFITGAVMGDSLLKDSIIIDSVIGTIRMFHDVMIMSTDLATGYPIWQKRYNTSEQWLFDQYLNDEWGEKILIRNDSQLVVCGHSIAYPNIYIPSRDGFLLPTNLNGWPAPHTHFGDTMQDYLYDMVLDADTILMAGHSNTLNLSRYDIYLVERYPAVTDTCLYVTHPTPFWHFDVNTDSVYWQPLDCAEELIEMIEEVIDVLAPVLCDKIKVQIYPRLKSPAHDALRIYPNPASDAVYVEGAEGAEILLSLYSIHGALVAKHRLYSGDLFSVSQLQPGVYIALAITSTGLQQSFRLIIQ
jgi:hypothetical protein